jgi:hypothetical protein
MSDIANELRERSLRAEQEGEPLALLDEAADEIERLRSSHATAVQRLAYELGRLRLTDAEREAISRVYDLLCDRSRELQSATRLDEAHPLIQWAKTLQGLWERLSGSAAISGAGKSASAANTPPALTDAEREAIRLVVRDYGDLGNDDEACEQIAATLRTLLERLK